MPTVVATVQKYHSRYTSVMIPEVHLKADLILSFFKYLFFFKPGIR